ncbi:MAG: glycerate kinase [Gudongella sp.]|nr:glycerate kinase [Gudongella sp.]
MKIIIAPDSFKGSVSAIEVGESIKNGIEMVLPESEIMVIPIADGGEGTASTLVNALSGKWIDLQVTGPSGNKIESRYGVIEDEIAIIEMASASGLMLVKDGQLDPLKATTYGTGELIKDALERGYKKIYIGIGGSATTDGGVGMAQALGYSFLDIDGKELLLGGENLSGLAQIVGTNRNRLMDNAKFTVLCDVENPLFGENGAAYVYGPQKGATPEQVVLLDSGLRHYSKIILEQLGIDISDKKGAGAAGGLGAGLNIFCNARIKPGIGVILSILKFKELLMDCDLVVTSEGRIDSQSRQGKVPVGVSKLAKEAGVPVIVVVGGEGEDLDSLYDLGIDLILPIVNRPMELKYAIEDAQSLLFEAGKRIGRILKISIKGIGKSTN